MNNNNNISNYDAIREQHRKRLAQILRYIATMHQSLSIVGSNSNNENNNNATAVSSSSLFVDRDCIKNHNKNNNRNKRNNNDDDDANNSNTNNSNNYTTSIIPNFFHSKKNRNGGFILFTTDDFRSLLEWKDSVHDNERSQQSPSSLPFQFYAAGTSNNSNNTTSNRSRYSSLLLKKKQQNSSSSSSCWFRITRSKTKHHHFNNNASIPTTSDPYVRKYLENWLSQVNQSNSNNESSVRSIHDLLTYPRLVVKEPPKASSSIYTKNGKYRIELFMKQYTKYLQKLHYYHQIEQMYNKLFEWMQDSSSCCTSNSDNTSSNNNNGNYELVWGIGHARYYDSTTDTYINGPLLEILLQIELSNEDGSLLLRPRNHTGVTLNREVTSALISIMANTTTSNSTNSGNEYGASAVSSSAAAAHSSSVLASFHTAVSELNPNDISPGQPNTYVPLLKKMAVEISANGIFQSSSTPALSSSSSSSSMVGIEPNKLIVSEAWCVYTRPKPSSVWARDATIFADRLIGVGVIENDVVSKATYSFTHGPAMLDDANLSLSSQQQQQQNSSNPTSVVSRWLHSLFFNSSNGSNNNNDVTNDDNKNVNSLTTDPSHTNNKYVKPIFPLPSSDSQNRIAELLLMKHYPAVVCEGPPGTGKSHTIANIICSYLCQGKRVLVTSKNSPALSVLRHRLPKTIQELCVDVSSSECTGMRHLQQTVEKLAIRIASVNTDLEYQKYLYLKGTISELEKDIDEIDSKLNQRSESVRQFVRTNDGQQFVNLAISMMNDAPWIVKTMSSWTLEQLESMIEVTEKLVVDCKAGINNDNNTYDGLSGHVLPISDDLISFVASKAGATSFASVTNTAKMAIANVPIIGTASGWKQHSMDLHGLCDKLMLHERLPQNKSDWQFVMNKLKWIQAVDKYHKEVWMKYQRKDMWPEKDFLAHPEELQAFLDLLEKGRTIKQIEETMNIHEHLMFASECRSLDARRSVLAAKLQSLAVELVDATVVAELSQKFSADAQSALIRFAQLAGKQNFSQTTKLSKMSQRQRRRRQDYLDAFDRCCRFIPCWIMTTSQISDYLPPECLFDLAIIDESSQSDITALPGMLRGRQWLIVGDGKQVSPTETFLSEDTLESLRASLPPVPFASSMLPGQSFFDLCAQAFPRGRVVLNEHFRCAPEIISFSNANFYNDELVSMRLPTKSERLSPSILDVRVPNGKKIGKSNKEEADAIIKHIEEITSKSSKDNPRSIGIISLMGAEQSQLIRSGLLEAIGPHEVARHDILVGDPPTFQGTERDIIFLSMVCSKGSAPTQSQLMHFQRANVAMSRARDQLILYRSFDIQDVPSMEDMKIPIMEFFMLSNSDRGCNDVVIPIKKSIGTDSSHDLLERLLIERGYTVHSMGSVWKNAISVEHPLSDTRVGLIVECNEDSLQEWYMSYKQQKAIERVGWKCMRIDVISLVARSNETLDLVIRFLASNGIVEPRIVYDKLEEESTTSDQLDQPFDPLDIDVMQNEDSEGETNNRDDPEIARMELQPARRAADDINSVVVISSDDDERIVKARKVKLEPTNDDDFDVDYTVDPSNFGETVDLDFLLGTKAKKASGTRNVFGSQEPSFGIDNSSVHSSFDEDLMSLSIKKPRPRERLQSDREDEIDQRRTKRGKKRSSNDSDSDFDSSEQNRTSSRRFGKKQRDRRQKKGSKRNDEYERLDSWDSDGDLDRKMSSSMLNDEVVRSTLQDTDTPHDDSSNRRSKRYRRLEKYQRDGRWSQQDGDSNDEQHMYDTDSDLMEGSVEKLTEPSDHVASGGPACELVKTEGAHNNSNDTDGAEFEDDNNDNDSEYSEGK